MAKMAIMKTPKSAKIAELRNNLCKYLDHVRAGGTVTVLDRDTPIAEIVPLKRNLAPAKTAEEWLDRLERKGIITRGKGGDTRWILKLKPLKIKGSMVEELLKEREEGW